MQGEEIFEGQLLVLKGLELGQAIYNKELAEQILDNYDYDFVLGPIHNLENMEDFYFLDYSNYDVDDLLEKYFNAIYQLFAFGINLTLSCSFNLSFKIYQRKCENRY